MTMWLRDERQMFYSVCSPEHLSYILRWSQEPWQCRNRKEGSQNDKNRNPAILKNPGPPRIWDNLAKTLTVWSLIFHTFSFLLVLSTSHCSPFFWYSIVVHTWQLVQINLQDGPRRGSSKRVPWCKLYVQWSKLNEWKVIGIFSSAGSYIWKMEVKRTCDICDCSEVLKRFEAEINGDSGSRDSCHSSRAVSPHWWGDGK